MKIAKRTKRLVIILKTFSRDQGEEKLEGKSSDDERRGLGSGDWMGEEAIHNHYPFHEAPKLQI